MNQRRAIALQAAASMAICGVGMDCPMKETSVGSWFGLVGGMYTTAQYFEVDGVILALSSSYCGGRVALIVLQVNVGNMP